MRTEPKRTGATSTQSSEAETAPSTEHKQPKKLNLAAFGPEITLGSQALIAGFTAAKKQPAPVPAEGRRSDAQKITGALADQARGETRRASRSDVAPAQKPAARPARSDADAITDEVRRQRSSWTPASVHARPPRAPAGPYKLIPAYGGPQASAEMQFQAYQKLGALAQGHERSLAKLDERLRVAESRVLSARASRSNDEAKGVFREGVSDAVWAAERDVMVLHEVRRDLGEKYGAAKHELEKIVGIENGAGAGPGRDAGPPTSFRSFEEKLAAYNRSIDTLKRSGVFAVGVAGYAVGVEAGYGQKLGKRDREIMDRIGSAGVIAQQAAGAGVAHRGGALSGAASPAPGADHRQKTLDHSQAEAWRAAHPAAVGSR
jgi:hypothetical protein